MSKSKQLRFTATKIERTLRYYQTKTFKKILANHNRARKERQAFRPAECIYFGVTMNPVIEWVTWKPFDEYERCDRLFVDDRLMATVTYMRGVWEAHVENGTFACFKTHEAAIKFCEDNDGVTTG